MNFLNPFVLFGLAAASIPIILHLINLQRQKKVDFSTLKFLKELQQSSIRKLKLKQWLLLLLRILLIIFAVLAFARPTINTVLPGLTDYSNTSMIILLDNTYSMDVSDENGNRFRQAKNELNKLVSSLKEGDQAIVIPISSNKPIQNYNWTNSRDKLTSDISELKIGTNKPNLEKSLKFASILFDEAVNVNKQLFIVTDNQKNIIDELDTNQIINGNLPIVVNQIGKSSKKEFNNISIDSVRVLSSMVQKDRPIELEIFVTNWSDKKLTDNSVAVQFNETKVAQSTFTIAPQESQNFILSAKPDNSGPVSVRVSIENDEVLIDNNYFLTLNIPIKPNVLVYSDYENLFLKSVLDNLVEFNSISGYDYTQNLQGVSNSITNNVILLVDKKVLSDNEINGLQKTLANNINVILFAPIENVDTFIDGANKLNLNINELTRYEPSAAEFSNYDKLHPLFEGVFVGDNSENQTIESPKLMAELSNSNGRAIIETPSGNFLSEASIGESFLLYYSVPLVPKWSDFVTTGLFPTLVYKSIDYLNTLNNHKSNVSANSLKVPTSLTPSNRFEIKPPDGASLFLDANKVGDSYVLDIQEKSEFGNYYVYNNNKQLVAYYSVNHIQSESNLESVSNDEMVNSLENIGADANKIIFVNDDETINDSIQRARLGTELWQIFLILALLCGLTELIVQKHSKKVKLA
jgi:hypothetical protein